MLVFVLVEVVAVQWSICQMSSWIMSFGLSCLTPWRSTSNIVIFSYVKIRSLFLFSRRQFLKRPDNFGVPSCLSHVSSEFDSFDFC